MKVSIIIPTYNEAENIESIISYLMGAPCNEHIEIIIADGGSTDETVAISKKYEVTTLLSPNKGRAGQMNFGVQYATGNVLYFVHADSRPPLTFYTDIKLAIDKGFNCGCYRSQFDSKSLLLKANAFFTRFNMLFCRGGDQTIFVTRELFERVGPYKNDMLIMEDYDFLARIRKEGKFILFNKATVFSARKYDQNSWLKVQKANLTIVRMYKKGSSQQDMLDTYKRMLNYRKNAF
ncbi:MAG: TIGR04283 family arsenosugar biosynthesis glycosyltransferase [Ferruginibacter sp.]|nr:TIGR04283 family arsenosugar biosynthesis glycosyltransferase [Ferruginibacter sp.]